MSNLCCKFCSGKIEEVYVEEVLAKMKERQACFHCNFWLEKYENFYLKGESIVIDGEHYHDGGTCLENKLLGYYGRIFKIKMNDGRIIETNNLWHQGTIPEHFRDKMPNNAILINN